MQFESSSNNIKMSDEELDEAVANHLKKLDTLEIMEKFLEKTKIPPSEPPQTDTFCSDCVASGDWTETASSWLTNPRIFTQEMLNLSSLLGTSDWKTKNVHSITNTTTLPVKKYAASEDKESDVEDNSNFFVTIRDYLADYQESSGLPKDEYSFGSLLKVMGQTTGKSFLALFYILVNIAPMTQILLFVFRFILDKAISILSLKDTQQKATRSAIFGIQLISIYICLFFIFGSIWIPILKMVFGIISQIFIFN